MNNCVKCIQINHLLHQIKILNLLNSFELIHDIVIIIIISSVIYCLFRKILEKYLQIKK